MTLKCNRYFLIWNVEPSQPSTQFTFDIEKEI
ncbi:hypothetical protein T11_2676 [Trichinella zimbabwensis]|uniref:Uncharacterized protein n=1 Tax=Trichinella zimbabwensis TaxID=268475 RepID=A0A0V1F2S7_9BILA|nr:hypothetical protein T11_2676 [Trichinella zimbabwensis]